MSLEDVALNLRRLRALGQIATQHREPAMALGFGAEGVGYCAFPLTEDRIRALLEHAMASPFGYREETRRDASVRDSWEIPGAMLHVEDLQTSSRFERALKTITQSVGLPTGAVVTPVLQKLLIYGPRQFFAPHRDSQKTPDTSATMVVVLPASHVGGDVVVSHGGRQVRLSAAQDSSTGYLTFLGFYADCLHETRPVEAGHRVALTYSLEVQPNSRLSFDDRATPLQRSLQRFFVDQPWLVCLLDHQYAEQSLDWSRLKNADRVRSTALLQVAQEMGWDCFLALADVHESCELISDETDEDEQDHEVAIGSELGLEGALLGRELTLSSWIDGLGQSCQGTAQTADEQCIVATNDDSLGQYPYATSAEAWTGNEGGTAEKWYHHAALVVIERGTSLHAEVSQLKASKRPAEAPTVIRRRRQTPTD